MNLVPEKEAKKVVYAASNTYRTQVYASNQHTIARSGHYTACSSL